MAVCEQRTHVSDVILMIEEYVPIRMGTSSVGPLLSPIELVNPRFKEDGTSVVHSLWTASFYDLTNGRYIYKIQSPVIRNPILRKFVERNEQYCLDVSLSSDELCWPYQMTSTGTYRTKYILSLKKETVSQGPTQIRCC